MKYSYSSRAKIGFLLLVTLTLFACSGGEQYGKTEVMVTKDGYAIHGYDPVAFFTNDQARKGSEAHSYQWKEATWLFASEQNKNQFAENPEKYAPQYGGWCAYGASGGYAAETQPWDSWTVVNDKLYLNSDPGIVEEWSKDIPGYIKKADGLWGKLSSELNQGAAEVHWK